jgi:hypothetical protein
MAAHESFTFVAFSWISRVVLCVAGVSLAMSGEADRVLTASAFLVCVVNRFHGE